MRNVKRGVAWLLAFLVIQVGIAVLLKIAAPIMRRGASAPLSQHWGCFPWPWEHRGDPGWTVGNSVKENEPCWR